MYKIGEFSQISRLSVKTLHHYDEENILKPDYIDEETGYRYYRKESLEKAETIKLLRRLEFSVGEIRAITEKISSDDEMRDAILKRKIEIRAKKEHYSQISKELDLILKTIGDGKMKKNVAGDSGQIFIKTIDSIIFLGIRRKCGYDEVGSDFSECAKKAGRFICGKGMNLFYDGEYMESDADIETGFPIKKAIGGSRILKGGKAVCIVHKGRYDEIGKSFAMIYDYLSKNNVKAKIPIRLVYTKGPGMIFRGNPEKYLTEIQFIIEEN
ncbi:MAG TPA: MerR family transcriptional regulator [Spirochaetota bacterium]|nr:MerR family transcriptional regulator [Spirochaetota bacterium]HOH36645.1 MerR family transcriptional regulator [Spirochaetota bacterium]HPA63280.1 MerR family transcriptional regulator [Spirochaetota bacterium]HPY02754.1 MerR family transcriptional regulator [Spirochaetota bacterium]HQA52585.1 MerR family transcriptional regulator [Spirochaetota bacterium]